MKKAIQTFLYHTVSFGTKEWQHKVNSGDREKVSDHLPHVFIYFVYQKKKWMDETKVYTDVKYIITIEKSPFSKYHIGSTV